MVPQVDRIWGIWGSYYNVPTTIIYLLKGDYNDLGFWGSGFRVGFRIWGFGAFGFKA